MLIKDKQALLSRAWRRRRRARERDFGAREEVVIADLKGTAKNADFYLSNPQNKAFISGKERERSAHSPLSPLSPLSLSLLPKSAFFVFFLRQTRVLTT